MSQRTLYLVWSASDELCGFLALILPVLLGLAFGPLLLGGGEFFRLLAELEFVPDALMQAVPFLLGSLTVPESLVERSDLVRSATVGVAFELVVTVLSCGQAQSPRRGGPLQ